MEFSVWNYGTRKYDYYQAGEHEGTHITKPTVHSFAGSKIGMTVDQFAARVPAGASRAGSGDVAKGQVASFGAAGIPSWLLYGVALYLAWRYFR
jgi:hypothetical protein